MKPLTIILLAFLLLAGCSSPRIPNAAKLNARQAQLDANVKAGHQGAVAASMEFTKAATSLARAAEANAKATVGHSREQVLVGEIKPGLNQLRTKVTDVVLRDEIDALSLKFDELQALEIGTSDAIAATGAETESAKKSLDAGSKLQEGVIGHLDAADKDSEAIREELGPKYQTEANAEIFRQSTIASRAIAHLWMWISIAGALGVTAVVFIYLWIKKR